VTDHPTVRVRIQRRDVFCSSEHVSAIIRGRGHARHSWDKTNVRRSKHFRRIIRYISTAAVAVTHGSPCPTDTRATTAEEEVVVQLVLLDRTSAADDGNGSALDRECHCAVVFCRKYVTPEAVIVRLPLAFPAGEASP